MKKFEFRLDTVLDFRKQVLDERQGEYARAAEAVRVQQARVDDAAARYRELNRRFRDAAAEGITSADALSYENGLRLLEREIARETQVLQQLRDAAEKKRQQMVQAHVDTTVLERLREKKLQEYHKEEQKQQERLIDELVSAARYSQTG